MGAGGEEEERKPVPGIDRPRTADEIFGETDSKIAKASRKFLDTWMLAAPRYFKEKIVDKYRKNDEVWYHKRFRRVPTVDECYTSDVICVQEANEQLRRDRKVEASIIAILQDRFNACNLFYKYDTELFANRNDPESPCYKAWHDWRNAQVNYYIKYGDMGYDMSSIDVLMKQKHRLVWERRNGRKYLMESQPADKVYPYEDFQSQFSDWRQKSKGKVDDSP